MHSRTLTSIALLAVFTIAFVYCTNEQPPKTEISDTSPTSTIPPAPRYLTEDIPPCAPVEGAFVDPCEPVAAAISPEGSLGSGPEPRIMPTSTIPPAPQYLTEEIPPCAPVEGAFVDPCEPVAAATTSEGTLIVGPEPESIRSHLEGIRADGILVTHVVLRGAYVPGTVRCNFSGGANGIPSYYGAERQIEYLPFNAVNCYADVRVNAYIVGSGPPTLTVLARKFPYWLSETPENVAYTRNSAEAALIKGGHHNGGEVPAGGIAGREHVLFLDGSYDLSVEAWEVILTWDVQRLEDETVIAVHPQRDLWRQFLPDKYQIHRSKLEMELPAFTRAVTDVHQARLTEYGGRTGLDERLPMLVTDANRISQYYTVIGAYNHPDGPPIQPPPPCGLTVPNPADNPGLMLDCMPLLAAKGTLAGTATLDWSVDTAVTGWEGVTVAGSPRRVTKVLLSDESLSGTIPLELGDLSELTHLDLSSNFLTGEIPRELGRLSNLQEIRLSGNLLTGCIPVALKDVPTNDLSSLNLLDCPPAPEGLTAGTPGETSVALSWTAVSNASKYRVERRVRNTRGFGAEDPGARDWVVDDDTLTVTSHTLSGLNCRWEYSFRVSAYGNGTDYGADWGEPSDVLSSSGGECVPPTFDAISYTFSVPGDTPTGTVVGVVTASGSGSNDPVTYSIIGGDEDGKFDIHTSSGEITVAGDISSNAGSSVDLTVEARDESGGAATVTVTVAVTHTGST